MNFPKKVQARIWCVSVLYRQMMRNEEMRTLNQNELDLDSLSRFFYDRIIFEYESGDLDYFRDIYNAIANNLKTIEGYLPKMGVEPRAISKLFEAALICALAEMLFLGIQPDLLVIEYTRIMNNFGESGCHPVLSRLTEIDKD